MYHLSAIGIFALLLFALYIYLVLTGLISSRNKFKVNGRTVLITGGSQGTGRGVAKILAQNGANVIIVARNRDNLAAAKTYISASATRPDAQRFHYITADVTIYEENVRIIDEATKWNGGEPPDIVWANAGGCIPKFFMSSTIAEQRSQMELNYWAAAYLAYATLGKWLELKTPVSLDGKRSESERTRHFIMTSSAVAFVAVAGYTPYAVAKSAMRSLADSLRAEVNLYNGARQNLKASAPTANIKIHTIFSGSVQSPGFEEENKIKHPVTKKLEEGDPVQSEDEVASIAVQSLERGDQLVTTQFLSSAMKASALGGSPRNNWITDTILSWITSVVWLFYQPYMDSTVYKYGVQHGMSGLSEDVLNSEI